jgi:hypothetical protein
MVSAEAPPLGPGLLTEHPGYTKSVLSPRRMETNTWSMWTLMETLYPAIADGI